MKDDVYPLPWSCRGLGNAIHAPGSAWRESNGALARLLDSHRAGLVRAVVVAERIGRGIDALMPRLHALCRRTCRFCPDPCCILNTVWFDFRDLLFLHLLRIPIPPFQAASDSHTPCPYLTGCGCVLPPRSRPFMCLRYLCPAQRSILRKEGDRSRYALLERIEAIDLRRQQMEADVVRCIRRRRWIAVSEGSIGLETTSPIKAGTVIR